MSKPILSVTLTTADEKSITANALFDSGSFYSIIRSDILPKNTTIIKYKNPKELGTAGKGGKVKVVGETNLIITIGKKMINSRFIVSFDLNREVIIGAETMQSWDISIKNKNGHTQISVGHDMRDPEITEVD